MASSPPNPTGPPTGHPPPIPTGVSTGQPASGSPPAGNPKGPPPAPNPNEPPKGASSEHPLPESSPAAPSNGPPAQHPPGPPPALHPKEPPTQPAFNNPLPGPPLIDFPPKPPSGPPAQHPPGAPPSLHPKEPPSRPPINFPTVGPPPLDPPPKPTTGTPAEHPPPPPGQPPHPTGPLTDPSGHPPVQTTPTTRPEPGHEVPTTYSSPSTTPRNLEAGPPAPTPGESPEEAAERRHRENETENERRNQANETETQRRHQETTTQTERGWRYTRNTALMAVGLGGGFTVGSKVIPANDISWKSSGGGGHARRDGTTGVGMPTHPGGQPQPNMNHVPNSTGPDYMQHATPDGVPPKRDPTTTFSPEELQHLGQPRRGDIIVTPTPPTGGQQPAQTDPNKRFDPNGGSSQPATPNGRVPPKGPPNGPANPSAPRTRAKRFRA